MPRRVLGAVLGAAAGPALPIGIVVLLCATIGLGLAEASSLMPKASPPLGTSTLPGSPSPEAQAPAAPTVEPAVAPGGSRVARLPGLGPSAPDVAPPAGPRGHISAPSVGLSIPVVDYGDCTGNTPMTRSAAVHYQCTPAAVTALVGHNPGVFTPLLSTHPGDVIVYRTESGTDVTYHLRGSPVRESPGDAASATQDSSFTHMVLTTCAAPDSSSYWVFIAIPDNPTAGAPAGSQPPAAPPPAPSPAPTQPSLLGGLGI